jgi:hypothetical protein
MSIELTVTLTPQVSDLIDQLVECGIFGLDREEVALRLIDNGIIEYLRRQVVPLALHTQQPKKKRK